MSLTCNVCRASSADPRASISCTRPDCPAWPTPREERAWERGEHVDHQAGIEEKRERLALWDSLMPAVVAVFLLVAAVPVHAENCIGMGLKTAQFSMTKVQRVESAWRTDLVVNPATGMHEPVKVAIAWTNETVSMGKFKGYAEIIKAMKDDAKPGISYKITAPSTVYAIAAPKDPKAPICLDLIDDRLLIVRPVRGGGP